MIFLKLIKILSYFSKLQLFLGTIIYIYINKIKVFEKRDNLLDINDTFTKS